MTWLDTRKDIFQSTKTGTNGFLCTLVNALMEFKIIQWIFNFFSPKKQKHAITEKYGIGWDLVAHQVSGLWETEHKLKIFNRPWRQGGNKKLRLGTCSSKATHKLKNARVGFIELNFTIVFWPFPWNEYFSSQGFMGDVVNRLKMCVWNRTHGEHQKWN